MTVLHARMGGMLRRGWRSLLQQAVVGGLVLVAGVVYGFYLQPSAVAVIDLHELDGVAVRGGVLDMVATTRVNRGCLTATRRWLWRVVPTDPDELEWVYLPDVPFRPPVAIGVAHYRLRVPVPAFVEEGDWHYLGEADDDCSIWHRWFGQTRRSPDILVHVQTPAPARPAEVVTPPGAVTMLPADGVPAGDAR